MVSRNRGLLSVACALILGTAVAAAGEPKRRDVHGDALPRHAVARLGTVRWRSPPHLEYGHGYLGSQLSIGLRSGYGRVALAPDGRFIAALEAKKLSLWEAGTGKLIRWTSRLDYVRAVSFSPDSKTLLVETVGETYAVDNLNLSTNHFQRYEIRSGKLLDEGKLNHIQYSSNGAQFTADGKMVLLASSEGKFYLCERTTGKPVRIVEPNREFGGPVKVSAEGGRLAMVDQTRHWLGVFDTETGKEVFGAEVDRDLPDYFGGATALALSADGGRVAVVTPRALCLWDIATDERKQVAFDKPDAVVFDHGPMAFSPDGQFLALGDYKAIRLFEAKTLRPVRIFEEHHDQVFDLAFSADGQRLVSAQTHSVVMWDVSTGKPLAGGGGHHKPVIALAFSPQGDRLASGSEDGSAIVWDIATSKPVHRFFGHVIRATSVAFSPDGAILATGEHATAQHLGLYSFECQVRLWDTKGGKLRSEFPGHLTGVESLAFSPDGQLLASGGADARVKVWDPATGKRLYQIRGGLGPKLVAFSPDGEMLLVAGSAGELALWRPKTGQLVRDLGDQHGEGREVSTAGFLSGGKQPWSVETFRTPSGSGAMGIRIWDAETGRDKHFNEVCTAMSPDGRLWARIISPDNDKTRPGVELLDAQTGKPLATLEGHLAAIRTLAFSPDGKLLASGSADTTILLWDLTTLLQKLKP